MSAETLRRAAAQMRNDAARCGDEPSDFIPAVADWLDATAREFEALGNPHLSGHPQDGRRTAALVVARAYLGGDA